MINLAVTLWIVGSAIGMLGARSWPQALLGLAINLCGWWSAYLLIRLALM